MAMQTTQFNRTTMDISKNIKILTAAAFKTFDNEFKQIVNVESTDLKINKMMGYEGSGASPEKAEGASADQTRIFEGNIENIFMKSFVYQMPVTWEQRRFAVANASFMNQIGNYLARSMNLRYEYEAANVLNNGFSTSYVGGDSAAYFSASHTWVSGGTYSNLLSAADLSKTSLETALKTIANAKMEQGIPASLKAKNVIIAYENILVLPELLKSTMDPNTANNTYNAIQDFALTKTLNHYLSDTDAWYMDTEVNTRTMMQAQAPSFRSYVEDATNNLVEEGWASIGAGFHHQLGSYGNQGA